LDNPSLKFRPFWEHSRKEWEDCVRGDVIENGVQKPKLLKNLYYGHYRESRKGQFKFGPDLNYYCNGKPFVRYSTLQ
jgi:hypothetical protein